MTVTFLFGLYSCQKTSSPFGINAPYGLDVPTSTPTPTTGNFNIYVVDGTSPISGVTVFLVDPSGNTSTSITQNVVGFSAFNIPNVTNGIWTAGVSQQSYFGYSTMPITVTGNAAGNYYLTAPIQSLAVSNISSSQSYPYNTGTKLAYGVSYVQPGNLNEPVSLSCYPPGSLPTGWGVTFYPSILGTEIGANSGTVTVTIPPSPCTINQPVFYFTGIKFNSTNSQPNYIQSTPQTITKNFTSNFQLIQTFVRPASGFTGPVSLKVSSSFDCGNSWNISWTVYYVSSGATAYSGSGSASNGNSIYVGSFNDSLTNYLGISAVVTGYGYSFSGLGAIGFSNGNNTTIINSNF